MRLGENPRRLIRKRRYSSLEKSEDAVDTALDLMQRMASDTAQHFDKYRPEATGDVISGPAVDHVGTDVPVSFGDSKLIIRLFVWPDQFCALLCSI